MTKPDVEQPSVSKVRRGSTVPPTKPVYAHGGGRAEARRVERLAKRELERLSKKQQSADVETPPPAKAE